MSLGVNPLDQSQASALAARYGLVLGKIRPCKGGLKSLSFIKDGARGVQCRAIVSIAEDGNIQCHTGLYSESQIIDNGTALAVSLDHALDRASNDFAFLFELETSSDELSHSFATTMPAHPNPLAASLPLYIVSFEATGFTSEKALMEAVFSEQESLSYTEVAMSEGSLPPGVLGALRGRFAEDDEQGEKDVHVFVRFELLIQAKSLEASEAFAPPVEFLTNLSDVMAGGLSLDLERNSWEPVDGEDVNLVNDGALTELMAIALPELGVNNTAVPMTLSRRARVARP